MPNNNTTFAKSKVIELLKEHGAEPFGVRNNKDVWIFEDVTIIQLPVGNARIDWEIFEDIAEQINVSAWELDYWVGQN